MGCYKKLVFKDKELSLETCKSTGEALVEVFYSGLNYKDALGVTGRGPIFKESPIVPGIDFSGKALKGPLKGKNVIAQGCGFGESFDGGYTQYSECDEEHLMLLPEGLSLKEAMVLGTAGFTAALAVHRMLQNGLRPEMGKVLISGATGGVGGFAVQIFNQLGFEVTVVTNRMEHRDYLLELGATEVISPEDVHLKSPRALVKARWSGVVDNLGGEFLEAVLPQISLWGVVASIGLATGSDFKATVMPFILRGVSLLGISSTNCPMSLRKEIWAKLAAEWRPSKIECLVSKEISLEEVLDSAHKILDHKGKPGRVLIDLKK